MIKRSKEFLEVAYFLSRFGTERPPKILGVVSWNEAYNLFYEALGGGRTILTFSRSLKNARDAFDSHLSASIRIGWRTFQRAPNPLSANSKKILDRFTDLSEKDIWPLIERYARLKAAEYPQVFDELIGLQESEVDYGKAQTEGGRKMIISHRIERMPSLRWSALQIHGYNCMVCGFNFEEAYGKWGKGFIEVHHVRPLFQAKEEKTLTNPETDLAVVCANCHRMIHRKRECVLTLEELKSKIKTS